MRLRRSKKFIRLHRPFHRRTYHMGYRRDIKRTRGVIDEEFQLWNINDNRVRPSDALSAYDFRCDNAQYLVGKCNQRTSRQRDATAIASISNSKVSARAYFLWGVPLPGELGM